MTITNAEAITISEHLAATPAFLGYMPADIIVLVFLRAGRVSMVLDVELDQAPAGISTHLARLARREHMDSARILVIANARRAGAALRLGDAIRDQQEFHGTPVHGYAYTHLLERGAAYVDLCHGNDGTIPDPATTAAAVAAVADGRIILPGRADYAAGFVERPEPTVHQFIAADTEAAAPGFHADILGRLARIIARNQVPTTEIAARTAVLALHRDARAALFGLALIDIPAAAQVYTAIGNQLRGHQRAHMLSVAAVLYYVTGQGIASYEATAHAATAALTGDAEAAAHGQQPDAADRRAHRDAPELVKLMQTAHAHAIPVEFIRNILAAGQIAAAKFGIDTPEFGTR
ncbi:DUF4192 family protein [Nocardia yamanashiensis]|uniref:DUF4192 family protein n=1 Tax=Nocardia yamanashiensis TaxID=209247 RepID=UPI0008330F59|nr:DUF4192 family protein [Nocardia yamanashiensis]